MIIFFKSTCAGDHTPLPLPEKLILMLKDRVKNATTDQDKERAERDLEELQAVVGDRQTDAKSVVQPDRE